MALIQCTECGKQFSDKAPACPNCGCPTEIVLSELNSTESIDTQTSNTTADEALYTEDDFNEDSQANNIVASYITFGYPYDIDAGTDNFFRMTILLQKTRKEYSVKMDQGYAAMKNFDGVIENTPEFMAKMLTALLEMSVHLLHDAGIYGFDRDSFYNKYQSDIRIDEILEPVITKYLELEGEKQELEAYYAMLHESRKNTWAGGGVGIKGALTGYFQASLMNMGTSFLLSFPDNKAKSREISRIEENKAKVYNSKETRRAFRNAFLNIYDVCTNAVRIEMVNHGVWPERNFYEKEALSFIKSASKELAQPDCSMDTVETFCAQAFDLAPISVDVLDQLLSLDIDGLEEIKRFARDYGLMVAVKTKRESRAYQEKVQERKEREEKQSKLLKRIQDMLDAPIRFNETFFVLFDLCRSLIKEGAEPSSVNKYILQAFRKRSNSPISPAEYEEIISRISTDETWNNYESIQSEVVRLWESARQREEQEEAELKEAKRQKAEIVKCIKTECSQYAEKDNSGHFTLDGEKCRIKNLPDIKNVERYAKIPSVSYYAMHNSLQFDLDGRLKSSSSGEVVAFTNKGLFFCSAGNNCPIHIEWETLAKENITSQYNEIRFGGKKLTYFPSSMVELIVKIRQKIRIITKCTLCPHPDRSKAIKPFVEKQLLAIAKDTNFRTGEGKYGTHAISASSKAVFSNRDLIQICVSNRIVMPEGLSAYYIYAPKAVYGENNTSPFTTIYCITNYGILWSDSTTDEKWIYWADFVDVPINYVAGDYNKPASVSLNEWNLAFGDSSKLVTGFLTSVQQFLRSLRDKTSKFNLLILKDTDFTPDMVQLFDGSPDVSVYSLADDNFAEIAGSKFPQGQNTVEINGEGSIPYSLDAMKYIISFDSVNTAIMLSDNRMYINDGLSINCIETGQIITIKQTVDASSSLASLIIYVESSPAVSLKMPNLLTDKALLELNEWIYWSSPFKHAAYFSHGLVVAKDDDKALELYHLAAMLEDNEDTSYVSIGDILNGRALYIEAYTYYKKALDSKKSHSLRPGIYYRLARLYYEHSDLPFQDSYNIHYKAIDYMNTAAENNIFDAKSWLLRILNDADWLAKAKTEVREWKSLKENLTNICRRVQPSAYSGTDYSKMASQTVQGVSSLLKKAGKSFFGKK